MNSLRTVFGLLVMAGAACAQQYTISTVAGSGTQGWYGDTTAAIYAQLDFPLRIAVDSKGNYFFVDFLTQVIREVTTDGNINTIAGTGAYGYQGDNGPAVQGILSDVHGIAVGTNGNVYIADTHNARVRMIVPGGNITTVAGNGTVGYSGDGGAATSAALAQPSGVAVDSSGNIYIADYGNYSVRKVDSKGSISTFAGNGTWGYSGDGGPANKAALASPYALAIDSGGSLYISDVGNANIRKVTPDGNIQTIASNVAAESIAIDSGGSIYFPDGNATVQKIAPNGTRFAIAGSGNPGFAGDGGVATGAQLDQPYGVALDASGNVYVADSANQRIRLLAPAPSPIAIVNAASFVGYAIAPGEIVTIYGAGLGPSPGVSAQPGPNGFGTQLGGTTVSFGGTPGVVLYASSSQVNAIVPFNAPVGGAVDVVASYQGQSYTASQVSVAATAPGIFMAGNGPVAAVNQDGTINGPASPARVGSTVELYLTGFGQTNPNGVDGSITPAPAPVPQLTVTPYIDGQASALTYAGGAPGLVAGVIQANVVIPGLPSTVTGVATVPVVVVVGGYTGTQASATIYVTQ